MTKNFNDLFKAQIKESSCSLDTLNLEPMQNTGYFGFPEKSMEYFFSFTLSQPSAYSLSISAMFSTKQKMFLDQVKNH